MGSIGNLRATADPGAALFVDWSNIYLGRREAAWRRGEDPLAVRVSAPHLAALMAFGRPIEQAVAVVNEVTTPLPALRHIADGFRPITARPAAEGFEQTNDALLRERMWAALCGLKPGVMVLASGDGNGWDMGEGFSQPLLAARVEWAGRSRCSLGASPCIAVSPPRWRGSAAPSSCLMTTTTRSPSSKAVG